MVSPGSCPELKGGQARTKLGGPSTIIAIKTRGSAMAMTGGKFTRAKLEKTRAREKQERGNDYKPYL